MTILLARTNATLSESAMLTNRSINLTIPREVKSERKPRSILESEASLRKAHRNITKDTVDQVKLASKQHRVVVRAFKQKKDSVHNDKLFTILSTNPSAAFNTIKKARQSSSVQVPFIKVGKKKYAGENVIDGLFESISNLKYLDSEQLEASPYHDSLMEDYQYIKILCKEKFHVSPICLEKSSSILQRLKTNVIDFFSITANHYINAGSAGFVHFNLMLNALIMDVNNSSLDELNTVLAIFLYKGHKKDKTLDSSYRTISTCPLLAKGLDLHIRDLSIERWNDVQAATQYQGEG